MVGASDDCPQTQPIIPTYHPTTRQTHAATDTVGLLTPVAMPCQAEESPAEGACPSGGGRGVARIHREAGLESEVS